MCCFYVALLAQITDGADGVLTPIPPSYRLGRPFPIHVVSAPNTQYLLSTAQAEFCLHHLDRLCVIHMSNTGLIQTLTV